MKDVLYHAADPRDRSHDQYRLQPVLRHHITFLFDAVYTWAVTVLLAFLLTRFTALTIIQIYFCVQFIDIIKLVIGLLMLRSNFWAQNVVADI